MRGTFFREKCAENLGRSGTAWSSAVNPRTKFQISLNSQAPKPKRKSLGVGIWRMRFIWKLVVESSPHPGSVQSRDRPHNSLRVRHLVVTANCGLGDRGALPVRPGHLHSLHGGVAVETDVHGVGVLGPSSPPPSVPFLSTRSPGILRFPPLYPLFSHPLGGMFPRSIQYIFSKYSVHERKRLLSAVSRTRMAKWYGGNVGRRMRLLHDSRRGTD